MRDPGLKVRCGSQSDFVAATVGAANTKLIGASYAPDPQGKAQDHFNA